MRERIRRRRTTRRDAIRGIEEIELYIACIFMAKKSICDQAKSNASHWPTFIFNCLGCSMVYCGLDTTRRSRGLWQVGYYSSVAVIGPWTPTPIANRLLGPGNPAETKYAGIAGACAFQS